MPPDVLWKIERGAVRTLTWSGEGTVITLGLWGPGDIIGQRLTQIEPYKIECLTSVEVNRLPGDERSQVLDAGMLYAQQAAELCQIIRTKPAELCLQQLLVWLAQKFGHQVEQGKLIDLRLTHQDIAEIIGITRVTVTRLLNHLEQQGMIIRFRQHLILCRQ